MLSPPQAAIILQVGEDWLKEQRQKQSNPITDEDEKPLPFAKMGNARNSAVRYRLGDVRDHLASRRVVNTHGGRVSSFSSLADFMSRAQIEDSWLFAIPIDSSRPFDLFEALKLGINFNDAKWLHLGEYIDQMYHGIRVEDKNSLDNATAAASADSSTKWL